MSKPADRRAPRAAILAHVESAGYVPKAQRALFHELGLSRSERGPYREALDRLVEEGRVELLSRGRVAPADAGVAEGVLKRTGEGHGWVSPGGGRPAVFVPAEKLEGTLSGDRVRVDAGRSGRSGRDAGRVRVVEKRRREVVGVLARRDGRWTLRPFEPGIGDLRVPPRKTAGAGRTTSSSRASRRRPRASARARRRCSRSSVRSAIPAWTCASSSSASACARSFRGPFSPRPTGCPRASAPPRRSGASASTTRPR